MTNQVRIALAQINTTVGDLEGNTNKIIQTIRKAEIASADIILFPELTITGYFPEDLLLKKKFIEANKHSLEKLATKNQKILSIVGFVDEAQDKSKIYNAAAILQAGGIAGVCHKICLPNYGVFDEKRYFASGTQPLVFDFQGIKFGLNICEDIWVPDGVAESQGMAGGAEVILSISASPYFKQKRKERLAIASKPAKFTRSIVAYLNLVGGQDELVFDGNSFVVDHHGEVMFECAQFEEQLLIADIDVTQVRDFRKNNRDFARDKSNYKSHYKPVYQNFPANQKKTDKNEIQYTAPIILPEYEEIYQALILGTKDYVRKNDFKKVVIGLSGGIDSALVAAIATEALGAENVICVLMPSEITSTASNEDARALAENLGLEYKIIAINEPFNNYKKLLAEHFAGKPEDITEENLQARIRGNILMALSNKFGWMVLTTGNKSETSVGYCTLYGDMAGGFAVIKDVKKTTVYKICEMINQNAGKEIIPNEILTKPPTAELRPDQKDEDSLPPYDLLDAILEEFVEKDKTIGEIIALGYDEETVKRVAYLVDINEYKRRQAAPGVKITGKAFGKDRRMPITNRFRI